MKPTEYCVRRWPETSTGARPRHLLLSILQYPLELTEHQEQYLENVCFQEVKQNVNWGKAATHTVPTLV